MERETRTQPPRRDSGFTIVEVIVAIIVLTFGVMGMAGTTALMVRQVTLGELATKRAAAMQSAIERLRSMDWEDLGTGADTIGPYRVNWWIHIDDTQSRQMKIVTIGPGMSMASGFPTPTASDADTFTYRVLRR